MLSLCSGSEFGPRSGQRNRFWKRTELLFNRGDLTQKVPPFDPSAATGCISVAVLRGAGKTDGGASYRLYPVLGGIGVIERLEGYTCLE